ncbi:hypothetical protein ACS0TY_016575 [Phlomoides rotata]
MGNCLVLKEKVVRVMKSDGKILEYKHPIKVHQLLSQFSDHAVSHKLPSAKHMHPNAEMLRGHLYYLLPLPVSSPKTRKKTKKKKVRFSDEVGPPSGVVRIKVVMSKKELRRMVSEGEVRVDDMISKVQRDEVISKGWSPALDCIPEIH